MTIERLAALVVKSGVSLGGLPDEDRQLALSVAAAALPLGEGLAEAQVNARLRRSLAEECAFLATDHVELRRWLVDTGWWRRDGFGRCYERVPVGELDEALRPLAERVSRLDLPAWVTGTREARRAERERRRQAHAAAAGRAPGA